MSDFTGVEWCAALSAIGGIYLFNKKNYKPSDEQDKQE